MVCNASGVDRTAWPAQDPARGCRWNGYRDGHYAALVGGLAPVDARLKPLTTRLQAALAAAPAALPAQPQRPARVPRVVVRFTTRYRAWLPGSIVGLQARLATTLAKLGVVELMRPEEVVA
jgi:hypothetical protein